MQDCVTDMALRKIVNKEDPRLYFVDFYNRLQETEDSWLFPTPQMVRRFSKDKWEVQKVESKI